MKKNDGGTVPYDMFLTGEHYGTEFMRDEYICDTCMKGLDSRWNYCPWCGKETTNKKIRDAITDGLWRNNNAK